MTIVFTNSEIHIEHHRVPGTSVAFGTAVNSDVTLDKPGRFVAGQICMANLTTTDRVNVRLVSTSGISLLHGQAITQVRAHFFNFDGAVNETNAQAYIILIIAN